jgi:hypothetical protein
MPYIPHLWLVLKKAAIKCERVNLRRLNPSEVFWFDQPINIDFFAGENEVSFYDCEIYGHQWLSRPDNDGIFRCQRCGEEQFNQNPFM